MATKDDQKHLKCLKEEQKFLIRLQTMLQKQLTALKVEEAALLKMVSMTARGGSTPDANQDTTTATSINRIPTQSASGILHAGLNRSVMDDTAVNQAPIDLRNLKVGKMDSQSFPSLDIGTLPNDKSTNTEDRIDLRLSDSDEDESDEDIEIEQDYYDDEDDEDNYSDVF